MAATTTKPQISQQPKEPRDTVYRKMDAITAGTTFYPLAFAGIDVDSGYVKKFLGDDPTIYLAGVFDIDNPLRYDVAASAGVELIRVSRPEKLKVVVNGGGVAVTDVLKPVYAVADNDYQVSLTPPAYDKYVEPVGYIDEVISATVVNIRMLYKTQPRLGGGSRSTISFPVTLANISGAGDVVTNYTPGFAGKIVKMDFVVGTPVTTGSKAVDLNAEIGSTNLTGGVVALTSAAATPLGKIIAGSAITANNSFGPTDTISIEAANVTAFAEGSGAILLTLEAAANEAI